MIVMVKSAEINGFAQLTATFAMLISVSAGFCKTYFCFQCAVSELKFAKCLLPELNLANLN